MQSITFGSGNLGQQVGQNFGTMNQVVYLVAERQETPPQPFATIPFSRDPDFVDRGDILDRIDERCSKPAARIALVGLGGVGKSQLVIEFAHRIAVAQFNTWVFWVYAGTQARVEEGFRTIADAVKLPGRNQPEADIPQLVCDWLLKERNGRWIMILDSADDHDVFYGSINGNLRVRRPFATYLPQGNGSIIVTTRNKDLASRLTGGLKNIIEVGTMAQTDALTLLEKKLGSPLDTDVATDLVQALDLFPLAISQAAAYIQADAPRTTLQRFLAKVRKSEPKKSKLLGDDKGDLRRDGSVSNAILTTWTISFDRILSKRRSAADLLSLMSFFDRQGIPEWVLKFSTSIKATIQGRDPDSVRDGDSADSSSTIDSDRDGITDDDIDDEFDDDIRMLRDYCLIATNEVGDVFEMHGLVQLSTREWLKTSGQLEAFTQQYIKRLATSFPSGKYKNWATCQSLFAHVQVALNYQPSEDTLDIWAALLHNSGWYMWSQGKYEVAQRMLGEARKIRETRLGKNDLATLASTSLLATCLWSQGQWEGAEELEVGVMEVYKTKLGPDHPNTLKSVSDLAATYWDQGRWKDAEKLFTQVVKRSKTWLGAAHPDTLSCIANLAVIYQAQGRWEDAEKLQVQVVKALKSTLGANDPGTLLSIGNLAATYWNLGRQKEAEKLEVQVMESRKTILGANHPDTLISMGQLAATYRSQGRLEEAEKLEVEVMEISNTEFGADHPDTLMSITNLATTYRNQGRLKEAENLEFQVMKTSKTKFGADHPDTIRSMANLAATYWSQGRFKAAEKLEVQVMESYKDTLGADHPDTIMSMADLAATYKKQGRWRKAKELEVQVMENREINLGADHPDTLTSMASLAEIYWNQDQLEKAEKLEVQVLETRKTKLGIDHPDTLRSMADLAFTWKDQGRHSEALLLMEDCARARRRVIGEEHPDTQLSLSTVSEWSS